MLLFAKFSPFCARTERIMPVVVSKDMAEFVSGLFYTTAPQSVNALAV